MRKLLYLLSILFIFSCQTEKPNSASTQEYFKVTGKTMGTTYSVIYEDEKERNFKPEMDALLVAINADVSTYEPNSVITQFNKNTISDSLWAADNKHYDANVKLAMDIAQKTKGAFDPTITPLVNHWGFGYTGKNPISKIDTLVVDSLMEFVGFELLEWTEPMLGEKGRLSLMKMDGNVQLDLGGSAKGYALDEVGAFLEAKGVKNYLVEIGREVKGSGRNPKGKIWSIGINTPKADAALTDVEEIVLLDNMSVATSGNYRQSYEVDGRKISHIINPKTGYPEISNLLSVSVFSKECAVADAYATAFMVMGLKESLAFANAEKDLEALFIYSNADGELSMEMTNGMDKIATSMMKE
jgi:thiamine biosynthesis lipoprotein